MTRRVIAAREQVQLLSAWRKVGFDWKVTARYPEYHPEAQDAQARLENGHALNVSSGQWGSNRASDTYWDYDITDADGQIIASGGWDENGGNQRPTIRSPQEAKQRAEEHYQKLFPIGTDTGPHDSGVDYSDLNKFMEEP